MNWIRLSSEFPRHRKTLRLVRRLGKVARTYPVMLWLWAVEQSADGSLRDIDPDELAAICDHEGDSKELWRAMAECGFIEKTGDGWQIRSWDEHQGKLIERNQRNAERMRRARAANVPRTCSATDETNETNERDEQAASAEAEFDSLWAVCTKKVAKGAAKRTYLRLRKAGKMPPLADVTAKLVALQGSDSWSKDGRAYQPHLATWLNREGWLDEIPKPSSKTSWILAGGPRDHETKAEFDPVESSTWKRIRERLRASIPADEFKAWIAPLLVYSDRSDELVLAAPNARFVQSVEEHYCDHLDRCAAEIGDALFQIRLVVSSPRRKTA